LFSVALLVVGTLRGQQSEAVKAMKRSKRK
jgi:hypothetical protein